MVAAGERAELPRLVVRDGHLPRPGRLDPDRLARIPACTRRGSRCRPAERGLGLLALAAVFGWRRWPLLGVLWLGFATLGVIGGGNFHNHYYQQMVPPLALLAGIGGAEIWRRRSLPAIAVVRRRAGRDA